MPIDLTAVSLTELRYVVATADERHFGRAARACSVTQPTLSAQVQKLERTLGVQLFERSSKGVHLTPIGEEIVAQARLVLDATEKILDLVHSRREPLSGPLRLGVIPTLSPYLLPWLVPPLRKAYPHLELIFREVKTSELLDELAHHRLDAGILALPIPAPGIVNAPLFDEPFWLIVPRGHALAAKKRVSDDDLSGERVLLLDEGHCMRDQALAICNQSPSEIDERRADFRATSIETLRHMVAAGMGSTLLPALAVGEHDRNGRDVVAIPFSAPVPVRHMALAWRRTHPRAADFEALADFVREHLPESVSRAGPKISPTSKAATATSPRASSASSTPGKSAPGAASVAGKPASGASSVTGKAARK
jgi:LysR family hydrogen peroxide-inducible transcriptional activator